jgi:O-antigen ligase
MAGALVLLLFAWRDLRGVERGIVTEASLLMLVVLVLTKSRGGLLGLAAALVALVVLRWRRGGLIVPAGGLVAAFAVWRIGAARVVEALTATQSLGGLDGRLEVRSRAVFMAQDFPFTGIGRAGPERPPCDPGGLRSAPAAPT